MTFCCMQPRATPKSVRPAEHAIFSARNPPYTLWLRPDVRGQGGQLAVSDLEHKPENNKTGSPGVFRHFNIFLKKMAFIPSFSVYKWNWFIAYEAHNLVPWDAVYAVCWSFLIALTSKCALAWASWICTFFRKKWGHEARFCMSHDNLSQVSLFRMLFYVV